MGSTALMLAGLSVMRGVPERRWAHEAVARLERRDRAGLLPTAHAISAMLARVDGDMEAVSDAVARMEVALGGEEPLINQLPYVVAARAAGALAEGDAGRAQQIFRDGVDQFPESPMYRGWFLYEAVRAGADPRSVLDALTRAAAETDAPLTRAYARHVAALAAGDGDELVEVCETFGRIGAVLFGAEAAAHAVAAYGAAGRADAARRASATAARLMETSGAAATAPLRAARSDAPELTAREREIVALAAAGASNAEIAERLVLSVRTVETHLFRAMKKLGVSSRSELTPQ
jgi:ATP/maltotriose-dependent transcriptional regulator MalT